MRIDLHSALISRFSSLDEVYRIDIFGSEAEGCADEYSDIDMLVYSGDPARTKAHLHPIFAGIAPILATLFLGGGEDWYGEMVLLSDFSPYHKVDISIGCGLDLSKVKVKTVYDCPEKQTAPRSRLETLAIPKDASHRLNDVLFSVPRFTKCLFRKDLDMYRRWMSISNAAAAALYEDLTGVSSYGRKLAAYECKQLYRSLLADQLDLLKHVWPVDGKVSLVESYPLCVNFLVDFYRKQAAREGTALNAAFIEVTQGFMEEEIGHFRFRLSN